MYRIYSMPKSKPEKSYPDRGSNNYSLHQNLCLEPKESLVMLDGLLSTMLVAMQKRRLIGFR